MLTDTLAAGYVEAAARTGQDAALQNVTAITAFLLGKTALAPEGKVTALPKVVTRLRELQRKGGMPYATAARHIQFALAARTMIAKHALSHVRIVALGKADTVDGARDALLGFFKAMGCKSAEDIKKWAGGDGTPLTEDQRKALRVKPVRKAGAGGGGASIESLVEVIESAMSANGVSLGDVEAAILLLQTKQRELTAAKAVHETYSPDDCELMVLEYDEKAANGEISADVALHQIVDIWRHCSDAALGVTKIAEAETLWSEIIRDAA